MVTDTTPMNSNQAEWEVESAIYVYAPQVIPKIKDEAAQLPARLSEDWTAEVRRRSYQSCRHRPSLERAAG